MLLVTKKQQKNQKRKPVIIKVLIIKKEKINLMYQNYRIEKKKNLQKEII
jgi:hypothetical protein